MTETTCTTAAGLELVRLSDHVGGTKGALIRVQAELLDGQLVDTLTTLEKLQAFVDAASVPPAAATLDTSIDPATAPAVDSPASSTDAISLARVVRMSSLILANQSFHTVEMLQMATNIERLRADLEAMQGTDRALITNARDMVSAMQSMSDKFDKLHAQIQAQVAGTANDASLGTMADLADSIRSDMSTLADSTSDTLKRAQTLGTPDAQANTGDTGATPTPPASTGTVGSIGTTTGTPASTSGADTGTPTSAPVDSSSTPGSTPPADASTGPTGADTGSTTTTGTSADAGTTPPVPPVPPFGSAEG